MDSSDEIIVALILDFFRRKRLFGALLALENETGWSAENLGNELSLIRKLILNGDWEKAEALIKPLETSSPINFGQALFCLRKQQFFELIEAKERNGESCLNDLLTCLKGLERLCSGEQFKELCFFLTLSRLPDHPDFHQWSVLEGRFTAFHEVVKALQPLYGVVTSKPVSVNLESIVNSSMGASERMDQYKSTINGGGDCQVARKACQPEAAKAIHASIETNHSFPPRASNIQYIGLGKVREPVLDDSERPAAKPGPARDIFSALQQDQNISAEVGPPGSNESAANSVDPDHSLGHQEEDLESMDPIHVQECSLNSAIDAQDQRSVEVDTPDQKNTTPASLKPVAWTIQFDSPGPSSQRAGSAGKARASKSVEAEQNGAATDSPSFPPLRMPAAPAPKARVRPSEEEGREDSAHSGQRATSAGRGVRQAPPLSHSPSPPQALPASRKFLSTGHADDAHNKRHQQAFAKIEAPDERCRGESDLDSGEKKGRQQVSEPSSKKPFMHHGSEEIPADDFFSGGGGKRGEIQGRVRAGADVGTGVGKGGADWVNGSLGRLATRIDEDEERTSQSADAFEDDDAERREGIDFDEEGAERQHVTEALSRVGGKRGNFGIGRLEQDFGAARTEHIRELPPKPHGDVAATDAAGRGVAEKPVKPMPGAGRYAKAFDSERSDFGLCDPPPVADLSKDRGGVGAVHERGGLRVEGGIAVGENKDPIRGGHEPAGRRDLSFNKAQSRGARINQLQQRDAIEEADVIRAVAWGPTGAGLDREFALGTTGGCVQLVRLLEQNRSGKDWQLQPGVQMAGLHRGSVYALAWSPDGSSIATASNDKTVGLARVRSGPSSPLSLQGHNGTVRALSWWGQSSMPYGVDSDMALNTVPIFCCVGQGGAGGGFPLVSGGGGDCAIRVWDIGAGGRLKGALYAHRKAVQGLTQCGAEIVASGGEDGQVLLWDLRDTNTPCAQMETFVGADVLSVALHPEGNLLAGGLADSRVLEWDLRAGSHVLPQNVYNHHTNQCRSVEYTSDGSCLVTASFDGTVAISSTDALNGKSASDSLILAGHSDRVVQGRPHPNWPSLQMILSCSVDKTVRLWA